MSIYKKLFEAKKEIGAITKDTKNPFFKSNYFDINSLLREIEPILEKHNLLLLQPIKDGKVTTIIQEVCLEDKTSSGGFVSSDISLPNIPDPQKLGSAITYFRRYTLQSLLGLQAEDDDGNKAAKPVKKTEVKKKPNLTDEEFKQLNTPKNYKHIDAYLKVRTVTPEQLKGLNELKKLL